ncbi:MULTISPECIES: glycerophosphoryl diester phosphodiesterase membrane domain-containing protein [Oscillatoriales]|uniref:Glycerophosphoryl diester phosphodiesterase membrane domain-containing protein n=1 Tax=Limnospira maxima CS-328 TaxID=513049 RepID=B5VXG0_LIMMA|nr:MULTISPECIES: glycerophosphoryl diester phosphodiesterase membrane domain-containing protein [Oscillatoriales]EDZ96165.1 conserved hypothetical protein [Limnospira maxima CS-328]MBD2571907.1 glycerophosphoryl diester phosphodiesterase membrane domain-containing protein [Arthrospira platensis FACHB-971]MBD2713251.1 glycerophosphoryl diester phosphodiesterase membrane domain-containing protein [Arthrospira platensis FACHB-835]MDC0839568.1 glycerophosphoryl diester phosphodiesterase membrane do
MTNKYAHKSLNLGDVISAGFRIYRDHFKQYFTMAFFGILWLIVPIYGWAKFAAISGAIARLAFFEVSERPEPGADAKRYTDKRKWSFLGQSILVGLMIIGAFIGLAIAIGIAGLLVSILLSPESLVSLLLGFLLGVVAFVMFYVGLMWISARLYICDVILAVENPMTATGAISKSWQITKESAFKIIWILIVAGLATSPIGVVQLMIQITRLSINANAPDEITILVNLLFLPVLTAMSALTWPFFQSITAVIYYDIISRNGKQNRVTDRPKKPEI